MDRTETTTLMNATYTSTRKGEAILKRLTRAAGFTSENIISRLAIARSLTEPRDGWSLPADADSRGKQIKGFTLLGRQEVASALLAMIIEGETQPVRVDELRDLVRLHWERGLRLIEQDVGQEDIGELFISYAERAALADEGARDAALSPAKVFSSLIVGQRQLKRRIIDLLQSVAKVDPPTLPAPLTLTAPLGHGRSTVALAIAESLQLPYVRLESEMGVSKPELTRAIEHQLVTLGYAAVSRSPAVFPAAIVHVDFNGRVGAGLPLGFGAFSAEADGDTITFTGGGVIFTGTMADEQAAGQSLEMDSYTRDEVADILRREIGSWPLEIRRGLALAGRLNPSVSLSRAQEFMTRAREAPGGRPSEGLLIELMETEWGMDRLGLTRSDYGLLAALVAEDEPGQARVTTEETISFLERLGFLRAAVQGPEITTRGREALLAREGERQ